MLNPQVAQERLKEFAVVVVAKEDDQNTDEQIEEIRVARAQSLPESLQAVAFGLLERNAEGKPFRSPDEAIWSHQKEEAQARKAALERLDALSEDERATVFGVLFPKMGRHIARAWAALADAPYQSGWQRKAFRSKGRPELTRDARGQWLSMLDNAALYHEQDVAWFAQWTMYAGGRYGSYMAGHFGALFAAAIDGGGEEGNAVFDILVESAKGEHEIGAMGRHVTRGLLAASRPDGWEFMGKYLLAAQRNEGLRQAILEVMDEAHPQAFRHLLTVARENDLMRFSSLVRAIDVWLGMGWDVEKTAVKQANEALAYLETFLNDPAAGDAAIQSSDDGQVVYLALWCKAFLDAPATVPVAASLLNDAMVARRFVAAHLLNQLGLPEAKEALLPALDDSDLRIAVKAFQAINLWEYLQNRQQAVESTPAGAMLEALLGITEQTESEEEGLAEALEGMVAGSNSLAETPAPLPRTDLFERIERNIPRFPAEPKTLEPLVWPWGQLTAEQASLADALTYVLDDRPAETLLPYLPHMSPSGKVRTIELLGNDKTEKTALVRDTLLALAAEANMSVRSSALDALKKCTVEEPQEIVRLEALLTRKSAETRQAVMSLLIRRSDEAALESAERLTAAKDAQQRLAGLDMLHQMLQVKRSPEKVRTVARQFQGQRGSKITRGEETLLTPLVDEEHEQPTLENALGLMDTAQLSVGTPPQLPQNPPMLVSEAPKRILQALDDLVHEHREVEISLRGDLEEESETDTADTGEKILLGQANWRFPAPVNTIPIAEQLPALPLRSVWEDFWNNRPDELRDADGFETLRLQAYNGYANWVDNVKELKGKNAWLKDVMGRLATDTSGVKLRYDYTVTRILTWLTALDDAGREAEEGRSARLVEFLLNAAETTMALIPEAELARKPDLQRRWDFEEMDWRSKTPLVTWINLARHHMVSQSTHWSKAQIARLWGLLCWMSKPLPDATEMLPSIEEAVTAFRVGVANEDDLLNLLLGPRGSAGESAYYRTRSFDALRTLSARKGHELFETTPGLKEIVDRCRRRVIEVELTRGDSETAATYAALSLRYSGGAEVLVRVVAAMGKENFLRGSSYYETNRSAVFSHLIKGTFPTETDTPEAFAEVARVGQLTEQRLIDVALYAPQWASHVEHTLGWPEFADAVWWFHAHTKGNDWSVDAEIREVWTGEISDKTPLTASDLVEGAVDVAWFRRVYEALGADRWSQLDAAAKYASSSGGHKRAQLFADAMLGRADREQLLQRIADKRNQDALRALGLLPLPEEPAARKSDLLERYKRIQEFVRTSKQFGAQRQESEKLAARIALENLARTAGYPDPNRLTWAMEAEAVADLRDGATVTATAGEITVALAINPLGEPNLTITKNNKPLKNLPPAAKKDPAIAQLVERRTEIERQVSRMRLALEQAMCRGDLFTPSELVDLLGHPVLAPMLRSTVFVAGVGAVIGYPVVFAPPAPSGGDGYAAGGNVPLHRVESGFPPSVVSLSETTEGGNPDSAASTANPNTRSSGTLVPADSAPPEGAGGASLMLEDCHGQTVPVVEDASLRIAHPYDLLGTGEWDKWQRDCFLRERVQPFKQVFRELYVLTEQEREDKVLSRRYAGHQVNPKQASALFNKRGWIVHYEDGVRRTFHEEGITVTVEGMGLTLSPADVEGMTIEEVRFTRKGEWKSLPLEEIPPRVFSEAMRDLDLVVSVAHAGGVDPEASASTVEMRAALVREAARLLKLDNVRFEKSHVLIDGHLATYSVHLGSAIVHRQPGGFVCIVPVHSQHRGRLFLPFADNDPRTAEVVSKVLLLARDQEIKDPTILEQILAVK